MTDSPAFPSAPLYRATDKLAYTYAELGNRVKSISGSTTKNYHYDHMGRLLFETNASGNVTTAYVYAGGMVEAMKENNTSYFYHRDKTGNTISLTNSTGTVVQSYASEPFGDKVTTSGTLYNPFTFVGAFGVMNEGNGIYFMKNRYYDSVNGRFLQKDPLGLAGGDVNLYAYVGGNAVNMLDPQGLAGLVVNAGGQIEAGVGKGGATTANSGVGAFSGGPNGKFNVGGYTANGNFAGTARPDQFVVGASGGLGAGAFITNAKNSGDLQGPFDTWTLNLPVISFQYASGGGTWTFGISFGKSCGLSASRYVVTTTCTSTNGCK